MLKRLFGLIMTVAVFGMAFAQGDLDLNRPLSADPNVRIGKLGNGMTYYIRHNSKPENRVMLQLATNAGAINETDAQVGLAHFCEHMMFNGTKNFPKNELVSFLQSTGVRFGGDINAYTSFDETVYMLEIPTDKEGLLEKGYQVLEDWAHQATLDGKAIDEERGVIIEEWRMGLGADDRMRKKSFPIILKNSLYAQRLPIGTVENLKNFKHESLRQFYKDYYRPNLQAIVVVGDVKLDEAEAKIKQHFGGIKNPVNAPERKTFGCPDNKEPLVAIVTDKEATSNTVAVLYKHPHKSCVTAGDFRKNILEALSSEMLNARFAELGQDPDAPFIYASQGSGQFIRPLDVYQLYAIAKEGKLTESFQVLLNESYRVERHGFLESELSRAKESLLKRYESTAKESDKTPSSDLASEYIENFLQNEAIPGAAFEYELAKQLLPAITVAEVSVVAQEGITEENILIQVNAPEKPESKVPTEAELLQILAKTKVDTTLLPYVDLFREDPLVELPIKPASGAKITSKDGLNNITTVQLSNGIVIRLKPTTFKNDEILLSAYNLGGTSLLDLPDFISATFSGSIQDESGLGSFDNTELSKKLKGKNVSLQAGLSSLQASISGSSSVADLETMLQLNYLTFTAPRKDGKACKNFVSKTSNRSKLMKASPVYTFIDSLVRVAANNDPRAILIPTLEQLQKVDSNRVYEIFKEQFANAGTFKFYMVGNFEINDQLLSMLETYIGSLPVKEEVRQWRDVSMPFIENKIDFNIVKGSDDQGMVGIVFDVPIKWDMATRKAISFFKEIMDIKLVEVIREEMGGVYSPSVQLQLERYPKPHASFMVMFGCDPKRADEISNAVIEQIQILIKSGPTEGDMAKVKELQKRSFEKNSKENQFWLQVMENSDYMGTDLSTMNQAAQDKIIDGITNKIVQKTLKTYIKPSVYVRAVLLPDPAETEE